MATRHSDSVLWMFWNYGNWFSTFHFSFHNNSLISDQVPTLKASQNTNYLINVIKGSGLYIQHGFFLQESLVRCLDGRSVIIILLWGQTVKTEDWCNTPSFLLKSWLLKCKLLNSTLSTSTLICWKKIRTGSGKLNEETTVVFNDFWGVCNWIPQSGTILFKTMWQCATYLSEHQVFSLCNVPYGDELLDLSFRACWLQILT